MGNCTNLVVVCEVSSKPSGWSGYWYYNDSWNKSSAKIVWNSKEVYTDENGIIYAITADENAIVVNYLGTKPSVSVHSVVNGCTVTQVADYAIKDNKVIVELYLPSTVATIGNFESSQ